MERPLIIQNNTQYDNQVFIDSAKVYSKLRTYNDAYTNYLTCLENHPKIVDPVTKKIQRDPSSNYVYTDQDCVPPDSESLIRDIKDLQSNVMRMTDSSDTSYNEILQKHKDMIHIRNQLDLKLQQLYSLNGTLPMEIQQQTDTTLYATIMWTILATSMIYLIFVVEIDSD